MNFKLGLVVNPFAGIGGAVAMKGSDGDEIRDEAFSRGAVSEVAPRVRAVLDALLSKQDAIDFFTVAGAMGADLCHAQGWSCKIIDLDLPDQTYAEHTKTAVELLQLEKLDLILFAGGDGTARDVFDVVDKNQLVLGIPCGVKMHSGVFANSPDAAAKVLISMVNGELMTVVRGEVRDIDEEACRQGIVRAKFYGELWVPEALRYMQAVKSGGVEVDGLALAEIAVDIIENMQAECTYLVGAGTTTKAIMDQLGLANTLLGVDIIKDGELLFSDVSEVEIFNYLEKEASAKKGVLCKMLITAIGGQGHILGRGNQQFSPRVIGMLGLDNIVVIATKAKLSSFGNCLRVDTGDVELDTKLRGYKRVHTGYEDAVICKVL